MAEGLIAFVPPIPKHAVELLRGWRCRFDNFWVEVTGEGLDEQSWGELMAQLRGDGFWEDEAVWVALCERLPQFRLSKFQRAMPEWAVREMLGEVLLDAGRARLTAADWVAPAPVSPVDEIVDD